MLPGLSHKDIEMRGIGSLVAVVTLTTVLYGQRPAEAPSFRTSASELVVLPVVITDTDDVFVSDLPADRFTVLDNGRPQPITFFTNEDTPVTIGIVIDNSGSMRGKIGEVIAATLALARSSNSQDELFTLEFNDRVRDPIPGHQFLLANDLETLESGLLTLRPEGRTALYDALQTALDRLDRATWARKILVVVSDGGDNASQATLDDVLARARRTSTAFYTIGLFAPVDLDANPGVLQSLARSTGGVRYLPRTPGVLMENCLRIAREIRSGYTIGYEPPDRDGTYHRLDVRVEPADGRRLKVRSRPGYFAAGGGNLR